MSTSDNPERYNQTTVRQQLCDIMLADALANQRSNDTLREKFVTVLLSKAEKMEPEKIIEMMSKLSTSDSLERYEKFSKMFSGNNA